jgi:hypothetical protein
MLGFFSDAKLPLFTIIIVTRAVQRLIKAIHTLIFFTFPTSVFFIAVHANVSHIISAMAHFFAYSVSVL